MSGYSGSRKQRKPHLPRIHLDEEPVTDGEIDFVYRLHVGPRDAGGAAAIQDWCYDAPERNEYYDLRTPPLSVNKYSERRIPRADYLVYIPA